ncbi:MAG: GNAT family N-acetyltransferase [Chitinophagaceae bacterium]|nr:GNAT family N-acetyltransferase [Chitinophagaceae bacterium]
MISIVIANEHDAELLGNIARISFIESHGHSAGQEDINAYINEKYSDAVFKEELNNATNIYHFIYYAGHAAGFSKIVMNCPYAGAEVNNITKMERLYLLKAFYDLKLGWKLLRHNIELAKRNGQAGMWLYVWKENERAVNFYTRAGFRITGSHDFQISPAHANPNHQMLLVF